MIWWTGCSSFRLCAPLLRTENYVGKASRLFRKVLQHNLLPLINLRWPGLTRCFLLVDLKQIHVNPLFCWVKLRSLFLFLGAKQPKKTPHVGWRWPWQTPPGPFLPRRTPFGKRIHFVGMPTRCIRNWRHLSWRWSSSTNFRNHCHGYMPSGKHTESYIEHGKGARVDLPIKNGDVPYVSLPEGG